MTRYYAVEARPESIEHTDSLMFQRVAGQSVEAMLENQGSPLVRLVARARADFLDAVHALLGADLSNEAGVTQARSLQAEARRYLDLVRYITAEQEDDTVYETSDLSEEEIEEADQFEDLIHGKRRAKPADTQ